MHFQKVVSAMSFVTANDTHLQKEVDNFQSFIHDSFVANGEASFGKKVESNTTQEVNRESRPQLFTLNGNSILDQSVISDSAMPFKFSDKFMQYNQSIC